MEPSAREHPSAGSRWRGLPLLRLQSDERLVAHVRRGDHAAFEALVDRYGPRLLGFCHHLLGSRDAAEDVLQDVFRAAYKAILTDDRPISLRPWLYRIARNRSFDQRRCAKAVDLASIDLRIADQGTNTIDTVHGREQFRLLMVDIQELPETQRSALLMREMGGLSYEQIAEAMEKTTSSVKALLVRARVSLTEAAGARSISCDDVQSELAEIAEGLRWGPSPIVHRHVRACSRCSL